jgi:hypothetical protein
MRKKGALIFTVACSVLLTVSFSLADDISGYVIPEYYSAVSNHTGADGIEGQHGFWIRRIYLGYNTDLGSGWSARIRLEMNSPAYESFTLDPFIKDAWLKKKLGGGVTLAVGIMDPPSFDRIENFWGLRFIEKTPPDFFKLASSRDFGIALDGKTKGGLVYTVMYGNYSSNKGETNKGKGIYGRLGYEFKSGYVEANAHYAGDGNKNKTFLSLFGGLKGSWGRFGVGYNYYDEKPEVGNSQNTGIISGFAVVKISRKTELFARYDHFTDLNLKDIGEYIPVPASQFDSRFLMAGLIFKVHDMIKVSPNVKYVFYSGDNAPDGDFYLNLTALIDFKSKFGGK